MKLQNLIIIFLAIAIPVIIILSVYVELQVETATLRAKYNKYLDNAAHDTVVAFQLNTINDEYASVADTKIKDIEGALNVFSSRLATSFGSTGAAKSYMMTYVPALLFTLYDGYYIYTPTKSWDSDTFKHELKSYVYYSRQYTNETGSRVLTINYSLDNYVAVYYKGDNFYESKAGYLEIKPSNYREFLSGLSDDKSRKYYEDAWSFTEWFNSIASQVSSANKLRISTSNSALPRVESEFNSEKFDVIKDSITNNLIQAMYIYGRNTSYDFEMPQLTGDDWDLISNNVCFIAFLQGLPVGTATYNDYVVAVSTENKEVVNENAIYYVGDDGSYHRLWCPHLSGNVRGVNRILFTGKDKSDYKRVPACYYCMVRASDSSFGKVEETYSFGNELNKRKSAYFTSLAREKKDLVKLSDFINGSVRIGR